MDNFFKKHTVKSFKLGNDTVTLETGKIARQATSAVMATMGKTSVLCTVVAKKSATHLDYFPLTVNYNEKSFAAGKIPGGFFKREGRPSTHEILTSRLIDRAIRPLFDSRFNREIQVINTVLSIEENKEADVLAMIATSAALSISGLPFNGPIGAINAGYDEQDGYILNPTLEQLKNSNLDMVVAGTKDAVLMVESEAKELNEDLMLGAVLFAHQEMKTIIDNIKEFADAADFDKVEWVPADDSEEKALAERLTQAFEGDLSEAYKLKDKKQRSEKISETHIKALATESEKENFDSSMFQNALKKIEKRIVREKILNNEPRIDGRDLNTVRPINIELDILPSVHGSAVFTRGETQAIVTTTLAQPSESQLVESLSGSYKDRFMLHYNFPPYCVGETGMIGSPKRREIGHGDLAKRAIKAVLPTEEEFPYAIRLVSDITESNGSSSMASVCGSSLSLMAAGVPISAPVTGIAMGLVKEGDKFAVITDILGDEDHLGDMDFKVAGTEKGITSLQMDIKIEGINEEIMETSLTKAREARMHILKIMNESIAESRENLADCAPKIHTIKVKTNKIKDIIGKGGAVIQDIIKQTNTEVNISDDGEVKIFTNNDENAALALEMIGKIIEEAEVDKVYAGTIKKIVDFGAFVNILPGKDGLLHISQISEERVEKIDDYFEEGQKINVKVIGVDRMGKIKLQYKDIDQG